MTDEKTADDTPAFLILGGTGFIGRNLVLHMIENVPDIPIVVADKTPPMLANLSPACDAAFKNPRVKFLQKDVARDDHVDQVFNHRPYKYVFNLCGETRFGQSDNDLQRKCVDTAVKCAQAAMVRGIEKWVEVSSARVYQPNKERPADENAPIEPFTSVARFRLQAEEALRGMSGLPLVILRPAIVYGPADKTGLMPRLVCAVGYKSTGQQMDFLWTPNLKINTVHVRDVCAAMVVVANEAAPGSLFNLADGCNLSQGTFNPMLETIFGIQTGFKSSAMNKAAKMMMSTAAAMSNDMHVPMWTELTTRLGILNTPLTPFIDEEILSKNPLHINGTKIVRETSFEYRFPNVTPDLLMEVIQEYVDMGLYPALDAV